MCTWKPWPRAFLALWTLLVLGSACSPRRDKEESYPPPEQNETPPVTQDTPPEDSTKADTTWTAGIVDLPGQGSEVAVLSSVREAEHPDYERLVFEFAKEARPGVHVEYIDRPVRQCGSGNVVPLAGDAWLLVKFSPAYAHTEEGRPTILERERFPNFHNLKELELICDFEGYVEWVAGVASPNRYRTFVLSNPSRVIVDIRP